MTLPRLALVAAAAAQLPSAAPALAAQPTACPPGWVKLVAGTYEGQVGGSRPDDTRVPVTTRIAVGATGCLAVTYVLHEAGGDKSGGGAVTAIMPCRAQFRWTDPYGTGVAVFGFNPPEGEFHGVFGNAGDPIVDPENTWDGKRAAAR